MLTYIDAKKVSNNIEKIIDEVNNDKQILIKKDDGKCVILLSLSNYNELLERAYKKQEGE